MSAQEPAGRQLPGRLANRYAVGPVIGRGGMATVYRARDTLLNRDVAIKVFRATAETAEQLQVQEAEAKLIASLNHHALTTLFDAGVDVTDPTHPRIYLVMEYIPGQDLREHLRRTGPLEPGQVCYLGFDLADGLQAVHEAGFLHRDIKPANVLLASRGAARRLRGKLADFGIASLIGAHADGETTTGTAAYLSPEQVEGEDMTAASDVYSLGLVLLEATTGRIAFPGSVVESTLARLDADPEIPASVPPGIAAVVRAMTARDPDDRIPAEEASDAFQAVIVDELVAHRRVDPALLARNEPDRLAAVRRADVLGGPPDEVFDRATRLAAALLRTPVALVAIIAADRIWFPSVTGWDEQHVDRNLMVRSAADPGDGPWSIPDALADPRTRSNPMVTGGPRFRSMAAAPLLNADQHYLGALCVFDQVPRTYSTDELETLRDLASMVLRRIESRTESQEQDEGHRHRSA